MSETHTEDQAEGKGGKGEESQNGEATERFGAAGGKSLGIGYLALTAAAVAALWGLLSVGSGLKAPSAGAGPTDPRAQASIDHVLWKLLLAGIVIIVAARVVGALLKRIHQPHVIGEIIAGILLGPSLLGKIWPGAFEFLFPVEIMPHLDLLAKLGLIFYMFLVGLELNFDLMRGRGHAAILVSHVSIVAPFLMGVALALWLYPTLGSGGEFNAFGLFIGAAMAITAFPVLARILTDRGLYKTQLGTVALTVGAVDDITAWSILAVIITIARAAEVTSALITVGIAVLFTLFTIYLVRPLMQRVARYYERRGAMSGAFLAVMFIGILIWSLVTEKLGIHVIFGAFLFGAVMPHRAGFVRELTDKLEDFSVVFLLPFFFTFSGIRTNIFAIGTSGKLWLMTLAILGVAILGKWGGSKLAARFAGLGWREAGALGVLVNCRGLTELIILNIGLQLGVLPSTAFAMMVIMAVVTTLMTEPALAWYYPRGLQRKMIREEEGEELEEEKAPAERWRILVAVGNPDTARELVHAATLIAGDRKGEAEILLLRVVAISGTEVSHATGVQDRVVEEAVDRLRPLVRACNEAGFDAVPLALPAGDVGETIVRIAGERDVDVVLLGHHEAIFGERLLGGIVGEVLRDAEADVAVLIDPGVARQLALRDRSRILVPYGGGFHEDAGLDLAVRLGSATGAELALLGAASEDGKNEELDRRASEVSDERGVVTKPLVVEGDVTEALVERADEFDLLVLGVTDRAVTQDDVLQTVRDEVMHRAGTPYLVVRRHGQDGAGGRLERWLNSLKRGPQQVLAVWRATSDSDVQDAEVATKERMDEQTRRDEETSEPRSSATPGSDTDKDRASG